MKLGKWVENGISRYVRCLLSRNKSNQTSLSCTTIWCLNGMGKEVNVGPVTTWIFSKPDEVRL